MTENNACEWLLSKPHLAMLLSAAMGDSFYEGELGCPARLARQFCRTALAEQEWEIKQDLPLFIYATKPAKKMIGGLLEYPAQNLEIEFRGLKTRFDFTIRTDSGQRSANALGDRIVALANEEAESFNQKSPAERESALREEYDAHVFISYAREDFPFVDKLAVDLDAFGFGILIDKSLRAGVRWPAKLKSMIAEADALIIIISPAAVESEWVEKELEHACAKKKPIFPVLCEPTTIPEGLAKYIADIQFADLTRRYRRGVDELAATISETLREGARS